jgi:hypothetical protein
LIQKIEVKAVRHTKLEADYAILFQVGRNGTQIKAFKVQAMKRTENCILKSLN